MNLPQSKCGGQSRPPLHPENFTKYGGPHEKWGGPAYSGLHVIRTLRSCQTTRPCSSSSSRMNYSNYSNNSTIRLLNYSTKYKSRAAVGIHFCDLERIGTYSNEQNLIYSTTFCTHLPLRIKHSIMSKSYACPFVLTQYRLQCPVITQCFKSISLSVDYVSSQFYTYIKSWCVQQCRFLQVVLTVLLFQREYFITYVLFPPTFFDREHIWHETGYEKSSSKSTFSITILQRNVSYWFSFCYIS